MKIENAFVPAEAYTEDMIYADSFTIDAGGIDLHIDGDIISASFENIDPLHIVSAVLLDPDEEVTTSERHWAQRVIDMKHVTSPEDIELLMQFLATTFEEWTENE